MMNGTAKTCEVVTDFRRLEQLSTDWVRLWEASSRREIFQDLGWIRAFWKAYGHKVSLCSPVVFNGEEVIGILPLVVQGDTLQFLGTPRSDYNDILCEDYLAADVLGIALEALLELPNRWKNCTLANLSGESLIVRHLRELPNQVRRHVELIFGCSCPAIALEENPEKVLANLLRKKSLRRHSNHLQHLGRLVFRHLEDRGEIRQHLTKFFQLHIERWAMTGRASLFLQPDTRDFYEALVDELDPSRQLRFGVLQLDGKPIAYHLGFELDRKFTWYQSTFDVGYWECAPGEVLLAELLRYAGRSGLREIDLTIGGEAHKNRFANQFRENFAVYLDGHSNRIRSCLDSAMRKARESGRLARRRLERSPRAHRALRRNALRVRSLLGRANHLVKQEALFGLSLKTAALVIRNNIWPREELFFFSRETRLLQTGVDEPRSDQCGLLITKGTLGDLAVLALTNPAFIDRTRLDEYRKRLRQGDQVYIARQGETIAVVIWSGVRRAIPASESCTLSQSKSDSPALLIYDCRSAPNLKDSVFSNVFVAIAREAAIQGMDAFIHASVLSRASRTSIEEVGFRLKPA